MVKRRHNSAHTFDTEHNNGLAELGDMLVEGGGGELNLRWDCWMGQGDCHLIKGIILLKEWVRGWGIGQCKGSVGHHLCYLLQLPEGGRKCG